MGQMRPAVDDETRAHSPGVRLAGFELDLGHKASVGDIAELVLQVTR